MLVPAGLAADLAGANERLANGIAFFGGRVVVRTDCHDRDTTHASARGASTVADCQITRFGGGG